MSSLSPSETFFVSSEMELKPDGHVHSRVQNKTSVDFFKVENNWKRTNFCSLVQTEDNNDEPFVLEF